VISQLINTLLRSTQRDDVTQDKLYFPDKYFTPENVTTAFKLSYIILIASKGHS